MLDKDGRRQLAYLVKIDDILPIPDYDRVEHAVVGGWRVIVKKDEFKPGDTAVYFEIDSRLPSNMECFKFLEKRHYKVKTLKMCKTISQGLLIPVNEIDGFELLPDGSVKDGKDKIHRTDDDSRFLTDILHVIHIEDADNNRKSKPRDKYKEMAGRHPKIFKNKFVKKLMKNKTGRKILYFLLGSAKKDESKRFPSHFEYIKKTDQERVENMPWVLDDKTPFIRTQKCDGSSATYILERKSHGKFEFYVCSRNVRMLSKDQDNFFDDNPYWEMAEKYNIKDKLEDILNKNKDLSYVCWQGEICGPKIQKNPQKLSERHLFLFHMIDSKTGMFDIREALKIWDKYEMEHVPIESDICVLPDDMETLKKSADGFYDESVCEGTRNCKREGFVYYKIDDPNFSFKNVSREYLLLK